jgi:hypothetical protein
LVLNKTDICRNDFTRGILNRSGLSSFSYGDRVAGYAAEAMVWAYVPGTEVNNLGVWHFYFINHIIDVTIYS